MENPLNKYFETELRADGLYLKVNRKQREMVDLDSVIRELKRLYVINCNFDRLEAIFNAGRGIFEKLGPDFEYYETHFDNFIDVVSPSPTTATMKISSNTMTVGVKPTEGMIKYAIQRKGIRYGIMDDVIKDFMREPKFDTTIDVAKGTPPEPGIDGRVELTVKIDPDSQPQILPDGRTDYRNITTFTAVKAKQVLARRIPPKKGKPGISVTGEEIESKEGADARLPGGLNTEISKDEMVLFAIKDGILYEKDGLICVGELLKIPGNVDYSVGNVKYSGDVVIDGGVKPGFIIEAEGNIEINGEVESAKIVSRKGFVTINKGIIGKGNTEIYGQKGVTVNFAQECAIRTDGNISFVKHLLHCTCRCETMTSDRKNAAVIGGSVRAFKSIDVPIIGNDKFVQTDIFILDKTRKALEDKKKDLLTVEEKLKKQLEPISRELKTKTNMLKQIGSAATDRQKMELKKWVDSYNEFMMKLKYINENVSKIDKQIKDPSRYDGSIHVSEKMYQGTRMNFYDVATKEMRHTVEAKNFRVDANSQLVEE